MVVGVYVFAESRKITELLHNNLTWSVQLPIMEVALLKSYQNIQPNFYLNDLKYQQRIYLS